MKNQLETPDRRLHDRFAVTGSPLAVMRPAPSLPGKLLRISREAAEIVYRQVNGACETTTNELDILVAGFTHGIILRRIPVKTVSDLPVPASAAGRQDHNRVRKRVVRFEKLTPAQLGQLQSFINSYAM